MIDGNLDQQLTLRVISSILRYLGDCEFKYSNEILISVCVHFFVG